MQSKAKTIEEYLTAVPAERREAFMRLRDTILANLPNGYKEEMNYGMIGYVVPHSIYPKGYHVTPSQPLPFAYIASQKNFIALYHMGIYADLKLLDWFVNEYTAQFNHKPDMGKSCIRFKKPEQIPYKLIAELMQKISVNEWVKLYEQNLVRNKKR